MDIGIGLPSAIPGVHAATVIDWARQGDERGFSTLAVTDRLTYSNYESVIVLAAAGAVTERIRLTTSVLLAPLRTNHVDFAKQMATLDRLSAGRLVLGVGVGRREDDYLRSGTDFHSRGAAMDALITGALAQWRGEVPGVGPAPHTPGGPPLLFGGSSPAAYRRMARFGTGWMAGGDSGEVFATRLSDARATWTEAGREGSPRIVALAYFALGPSARTEADDFLTRYYGFRGENAAQLVASDAVVSEDQVHERIAELSSAGCHELVFFPCSPDIAQLERLAQVLGH